MPSPLYHPAFAKRSASAAASRFATSRFSGPSAATVHWAEVMSSAETNVGSPPMVSSDHSMQPPVDRLPQLLDVIDLRRVYGKVVRGSSWARRTVLANSIVVTDGSVAPVIAAADAG